MLKLHPALLFLLLLAACSSSSSTMADGSVYPVDDAAADVKPDLGVPDSVADADTGSDAFVPFSFFITVNRVPADMNGSVPFENLAGQHEPFQLAVPRHGFSIDVLFMGSTARPDSLQVTADVPLGQHQAGEDLAPLFTKQGQVITLWIDSPMQLPEGQLTLTARMSDGSATHTSELSVQVVEKTFLLDPFRLEDSWLVVFNQDLYSISKSLDTQGNLSINSLAQPNGIADFEEDLRLIGLGTDSMLPSAAAVKNMGETGTNAIMLAWLKREIFKTLRAVFLLEPDGSQSADSVRIRFFADDDPGAPKLSDYQLQLLSGGESTRSFSAIAIGGGDLSSDYFGYSKTVDLHNLRNEDNVGPSAGVFSTKTIALLVEMMNSDPTVKGLLKVFFDGFIPELGAGGKPVGQHELDAQILAETFDPSSAGTEAASRHKNLTFIVETLGRLAGALTAHEIGHSLGLVANGPPPHGLFGGEKNATFVNGDRTTSAHIDTAGFNIMEAGPGTAPGAAFNVLQYLTDPVFNALNLEYLRGRIVVLER